MLDTDRLKDFGTQKAAVGQRMSFQHRKSSPKQMRHSKRETCHHVSGFCGFAGIRSLLLEGTAAS